MHGNFQPYDYRTDEERRLGVHERAAAAALGFPSASLHFAKKNAVVRISDEHALWASSLRISSGDRSIGALNIKAATQQEEDTRGGAALVIRSDASVVLQRCWVTAYTGSGVLACERSCLALLRCAMTNNSEESIWSGPSTTMRLHGCHVICNGSIIMYAGGPQQPALDVAFMAANVFADNVQPEKKDDDDEDPIGVDVLMLT